LAPAAYKALHPMGIAPVIEDGALKLGESGAIIEYVIHKYGDGRLSLPPEHPEYANYLFWFHFANGTFMPAEMTGMLTAILGLASDSAVVDSLMDRSRRGYAFLEQRLGEAPYLAGDEFTAADLIMFFPLTTMRAFGSKDISAFPNIQAYLQRVGSRPAYVSAMAKGDPGWKPLLA
jgi:glutathione S-transferase